MISDNTSILEPLKGYLWRMLEDGGRPWNQSEGSLLHEFGVRCARAAEVHYRTSLHGYPISQAQAEAAERYPLPTRHVLREEAVPGEKSPYCLYRFQYGVLEQKRLEPEGGWHAADRINPDEFALMRHAIDLSEHPYREEPQ